MKKIQKQSLIACIIIGMGLAGLVYNNNLSAMQKGSKWGRRSWPGRRPGPGRSPWPGRRRRSGRGERLFEIISELTKQLNMLKQEVNKIKEQTEFNKQALKGFNIGLQQFKGRLKELEQKVQ